MSDTKLEKIQKSEEEWRDQLTPEQYYIARQKGTEPPFTGAFYRHSENGVYHCVACDAPLFTSETKFDSGCGWPSFYQPIAGALDEHEDLSHGMHRIEVTCARCGAHLGHVFPDGPKPTGDRYCINSVSLNFEKTK
ncbi:peptide-methionine (R)-S-oxide reductase MsrB [Silvibacterium dinghuense]|uniref:Peptide methionine sulfoxide reductase MsrB n=1 Tax=Silvibacterium dinghuense TaxID=1560006 RepID=A0A4Q1S8C3_9BACT|nr:peptide-methionine (R)-S-oxide reductase MsrB [Silvibacterium dinghuense]RXS93254.1 peptide-methionine (R)-S-oxide reductase [Silvibacterium dinghuense]GGH04339.1 peptide methionine sulfoxide reductase MsrB [Silvibacterium dinghuense]